MKWLHWPWKELVPPEKLLSLSPLFQDQLLVRKITDILNILCIRNNHVVGSDFNFISTIFTITFAAGVENVLVHTEIPILDDTTAEETEMFTASLTSTDQSVQITDGTATVHILDNDSEPLQLHYVCLTGKLNGEFNVPLLVCIIRAGIVSDK